EGRRWATQPWLVSMMVKPVTTMRKLSELVSCWKGTLIDDAFAAVAEGLRRERERLGRCPFLVVATRREFDIDGLTEYVDVLAPASSEEEAQAMVTQLAGASERRYGSPSWPLVRCDESEVARRRNATAGVARVAYRGFQRADP